MTVSFFGLMKVPVLVISASAPRGGYNVNTLFPVLYLSPGKLMGYMHSTLVFHFPPDAHPVCYLLILRLNGLGHRYQWLSTALKEAKTSSYVKRNHSAQAGEW